MWGQAMLALKQLDHSPVGMQVVNQWVPHQPSIQTNLPWNEPPSQMPKQCPLAKPLSKFQQVALSQSIILCLPVQSSRPLTYFLVSRRSQGSLEIPHCQLPLPPQQTLCSRMQQVLGSQEVMISLQQSFRAPQPAQLLQEMSNLMTRAKPLSPFSLHMMVYLPPAAEPLPARKVLRSQLQRQHHSSWMRLLAALLSLNI